MLYIVVKPENYMSSYILHPVADEYPNIRFVKFEKIPSRCLNKVRKFLRAFFVRRKGLWTERFYTRNFLSALKEIKPEDKVLFFSVKHLKDICILDTEICAACKSVYLWDPLSSVCKGRYRRWEYRTAMHRVGMNIYTFDPVDAKLFGFGYMPQVYRRPDRPDFLCAAPTYDVFFIGQDKKRSMQLAKVVELLSEANLRADIRIFRDKHTKQVPILQPYYTSQRLPYVESFSMIAQSRCLLEIVQLGQQGLTLRVMEALFLRRKLLTNNKAIQSYDFYHPDNILVMTSETTADDVKQFLSRPLHAIPDSVIAKHDILVWIKNFL